MCLLTTFSETEWMHCKNNTTFHHIFNVFTVRTPLTDSEQQRFVIKHASWTVKSSYSICVGFTHMGCLRTGPTQKLLIRVQFTGNPCSCRTCTVSTLMTTMQYINLRVTWVLRLVLVSTWTNPDLVFCLDLLHSSIQHGTTWYSTRCICVPKADHHHIKSHTYVLSAPFNCHDT